MAKYQEASETTGKVLWLRIPAVIVLAVLVQPLSLAWCQIDRMLPTIQRGDLNRVKELVEEDKSLVNRKVSNGYTPLQIAISSRKNDIAKFLLSQNADIEQKNNYEQTALVLALSSRNKEMVELLLDKGADVNSLDRSKSSAVSYAIMYFSRDTDLVKKFVERADDLNARSGNRGTFLQLACQYGQVEIVNYLLDKGAKVDVTDQNGVSPLMMSMQSGRTQIAERLIEKGADIDRVDKQGRSVLLWATYSGNPKSIEFAATRIKDPNVADQGGTTALHQAILSNNADAVRIMLDNGAKLTEPKNNQQVPMVFAASTGNAKLFKLLCEQKPDINVADAQGNTPLHSIAQGGWAGMNRQLTPEVRNSFGQMAEMAIELGGNADTKNKAGQTPLELAVIAENFQVIDVLVKNLETIPESLGGESSSLHWAARNGLANLVKKIIGSGNDTQVDALNEDKQTPLILAASNGHTEIVAALAKAGADPNAKDAFGESALLTACWNGHLPVVQLLIDLKVRLDEADESGQTAMHLAAWQGHLDVAKVLLANKVPATQASRTGSTPLHAACWQGNAEFVPILVEAGANLDARDSDGDTPLHKAAMRGFTEVVRQLVAQGANVEVKDEIGLTAADKAGGNGKEQIVEMLGKK